MFQSVALRLVESSLSFTRKPCQKHAKTFDNCVQASPDLATREAFFIGSSRTSWSRVAISLITTVRFLVPNIENILERYWRQINLRWKVWGWKFRVQARPARFTFNGQCRSRHKWFPVLHYDCSDTSPRRKARSFRTCPQGHWHRSPIGKHPQKRRKTVEKMWN